LTGPAEPQTGLQFTRTVSLGADSPHINFHAVIKNASGHRIEWSVQSVSQYNTADARDSSRHNQNFWAFSRTNSSSSYLNRYHVKFGPAENTAAQVRRTGSSPCIMFLSQQSCGLIQRRLVGYGGWRQSLRNGRAISIRRREAIPRKGLGHFWTNGPELRNTLMVRPVSDLPTKSLQFCIWRLNLTHRWCGSSLASLTISTRSGFQPGPTRTFRV